MGNGLVLRDQAGIINSLNVNQEWIQKNVPYCTSPKNLCIVTGFGDSMQGIFNSGDPLIVDRGVTSCDYDGIYFFRVGNEGYIKRLQRIPSVGIRVISENKAYEAWTITDGMDFVVFAKVLKAWRGENY
jgi:phage repressor protein C with HTH and peptisase S24 domain